MILKHLVDLIVFFYFNSLRQIKRALDLLESRHDIQPEILNRVDSAETSPKSSIKTKDIEAPVFEFLTKYRDCRQNLLSLHAKIKELRNAHDSLEELRRHACLNVEDQRSATNSALKHLKSKHHFAFLASAEAQMRCMHQKNIVSMLTELVIQLDSREHLDFSENCKTTAFGSEWFQAKPLIEKDPFSLFWLYFFFSRSPGRQLPLCPVLYLSSFSTNPSGEISTFVNSCSQFKWGIVVISLGDTHRPSFFISVLDMRDHSQVDMYLFERHDEYSKWFGQLRLEDTNRIRVIALHLPELIDRNQAKSFLENSTKFNANSLLAVNILELIAVVDCFSVKECGTNKDLPSTLILSKLKHLYESIFEDCLTLVDKLESAARVSKMDIEWNEVSRLLTAVEDIEAFSSDSSR